MKKITLIALITILTINLSIAQENYKRILITNTSEETIHKLDHLGIDLTCGAILSHNSLQIELSESELNRIDTNNINYNVLINDLSKFYSERATKDLPFARQELEQEKSLAQERSYSVGELINNVGQHDECDEINWAVPKNWNLNPNPSPNSFGGCLTYDMVLQELDDMRAYSIANGLNIISEKLDASLVSGEADNAMNKQQSVEGRTIYYVRISDNPDSDESGEPETLYQSLIHSREASTVMNQLFFMWYILENYQNDAGIRNLVNNQALYFIPVFNPDGFVHNENIEPDGGGLQRKNRNLNLGSCGSTATSDDYGVDLNRNSNYYYNNGGASSDPCSQTYRGTGAFSEPETEIMRDFFLDHDFEIALNHHSFKNAMLHAYAGTGITNPRPDEYSKYNYDMTYYNRYAHGPSTSISGLNSGNMNDWMLGGTVQDPNGSFGSGKNTMAWTPENGSSSEAGVTGSGFWPSPSNFLPIARRAMRMNFMAAYFSGKYGKLHDLNQSDITATSGDLTFAIENLGQQASDYTVTVTPILGLNTVGAPVMESFSDTEILDQRIINISYTLSPGIQADDKIKFRVVLTNDYATDNVLYDAYITKHYSPTVDFTDNPDTDNLTNWSSTGLWTTTSDAYSGSTAITTTASGIYPANRSEQLQMNSFVNLTGVDAAVIQYYAKWDLERSFDYVQIEGSTDGSNWTPLCGKLTKPGAPDENNTYSSTNDGGDTVNNKTGADLIFQPDGQPLYDGDTQDKWNLEEIVIDDFNNSFLLNQPTVFLRFDFNTDSSNRKDSYANADFEGFTFDDFKVIEIQADCDNSTAPTGLEVIAITATSATATWDEIINTNYDLRYREIGAGTWNEELDLTTNSFNFTGLNPATDYEVQIASKCGAVASSYSISFNFCTVDPCTSTIDTFTDTAATSYSESFETDLGGWEQDSNDDFDWTRQEEEPGGDNDSTPSNNTGPELASDGQYFIYIEASDPNFPTKNAKLISPCIDLSLYENAQFSYDYHMFGDNIGELTIAVSTDFGTNYTILNTYTLDGEQNSSHSDPWKTQTVNLSAYDGQLIKLQFSATTDSDGSNGWQGDISLDNFSIIADVSTLNNQVFEASDVRVFPNPFNDQLTIQLSNNIINDDFNLMIYDISGRVIFNTKNVKINSNKIQLNDFEKLATGSYFIKLTNTSRNDFIVKRVIKK